MVVHYKHNRNHHGFHVYILYFCQQKTLTIFHHLYLTLDHDGVISTMRSRVPGSPVTSPPALDRDGAASPGGDVTRLPFQARRGAPELGPGTSGRNSAVGTHGAGYPTLTVRGVGTPRPTKSGEESRKFDDRVVHDVHDL